MWFDIRTRLVALAVQALRNLLCGNPAWYVPTAGSMLHKSSRRFDTRRLCVRSLAYTSERSTCLALSLCKVLSPYLYCAYLEPFRKLRL